MKPITSLSTTALREIAERSGAAGASPATAVADTTLVPDQSPYDAPRLPADSANYPAAGRGEFYDRRRGARDRGTLMQHLTTNGLDADEWSTGAPTDRTVAAQTPLRRIGLAALAAEESVATSIAMAAEAGLPLTLCESGEPAELAPETDRLVRQILDRGLAEAIAGAGADARDWVGWGWDRAGLELRIHTFAGHAAATLTRDPVIRHAILGDRVAAQRGRYVATPTAAGYFLRVVLPVAEPDGAVASHSEAA